MTGTGNRVDISMPNYVEWPNQQWAFAHMRELIASAHVERADQPSTLAYNLRDLSDFRFEHAGRTYSWAEYQAQAHVDGLMVVHRGEVIHEYYAQHMKPSDRHMAMSVTKSFISTIAGILIDQKRLA